MRSRHVVLRRGEKWQWILYCHAESDTPLSVQVSSAVLGQRGAAWQGRRVPWMWKRSRSQQWTNTTWSENVPCWNTPRRSPRPLRAAWAGQQEKLVRCWGCYSVAKALETPTSQLGVLWSSEVNSVKGDDLLFGVPNNLAAKQVMLEGWDKLGFPSRTVQMNRTSVLLQESWGEQSWEGGNASQVQWIPGVTNVRVSVAVLSIMVSQVASAAPQCHILNAVPLCCTWL